jgi:S-adenosyl-L-methionine hydrolase (adenosine-forming)
MQPTPLIVLLTDFGTLDPFTGIMKGVIAGIAPGTPVIDLTNEIPPGDILRGAVTLWQAKPYFPSGTIFVGVVDPGVGTARRAVRIDTQGLVLIGPDNGLFSLTIGSKGYQAWELRNPRLSLPAPGVTFHGRDLFSPAAAHSALGVAGPEFGPPSRELTALNPPRLERTGPGELRGEILFPDRFGNLQTSLGRFVPIPESFFELDPWVEMQEKSVEMGNKNSILRIRLAQARLFLPDGASLPWARTFVDAPEGGCAFLVGSSGLVEIVAKNRSAADLLGLERGDQVTLRFQGGITRG